MMTLTRIAASLLTAALVLLPQPGFSQAAISPAGLLSNTTLNGAISATQTTLVLTSASASSGSSFGAPAAGQCLYIDRELMRIVSMSSTTATVQRNIAAGPSGTAAGPHATLAIILTGPCNGNQGGFMRSDPPNLGGNQDCTQFVLPWVNVNTGDSWWCELAAGPSGFALGSWSVTNTSTRQGSAGSRRVGQ